MERVKVVIFDLFGVLLHLEVEDVEQVITRTHLPIEAKGFHKAFKEVFQKHRYVDVTRGIDVLASLLHAETNIAFKAEEYAFFNTVEDHLSLIPSGYLLVEFAKKVGLKICILSNAFQIANHVYKEELFDATFFSCDTGILKPDMKAYEQVLQYFSVQANECLLIGDNYEKDLKTAEELGMRILLFNRLLEDGK